MLIISILSILLMVFITRILLTMLIIFIIVIVIITLITTIIIKIPPNNRWEIDNKPARPHLGGASRRPDGVYSVFIKSPSVFLRYCHNYCNSYCNKHRNNNCNNCNNSNNRNNSNNSNNTVNIGKSLGNFLVWKVACDIPRKIPWDIPCFFFFSGLH